jgi:hypothetical protein
MKIFVFRSLSSPGWPKKNNQVLGVPLVLA